VSSSIVSPKALRILAEGRVSPDAGAPPQLFHVEGDHGRYAVVIGATVQMCSCPARGLCSHIAAATAWATASEGERALMVEALGERRARDARAADELFARLAS
jgi:hypothetical protein